MTRIPRREVDGKPLPAALRDEGIPEWIDEPTQPTRVPSNEELEAELHLLGGGAGNWDYRKGPL